LGLGALAMHWTEGSVFVELRSLNLLFELLLEVHVLPDQLLILFPFSLRKQSLREPCRGSADCFVRSLSSHTTCHSCWRLLTLSWPDVKFEHNSTINGTRECRSEVDLAVLAEAVLDAELPLLVGVFVQTGLDVDLRL